MVNKIDSIIDNARSYGFIEPKKILDIAIPNAKNWIWYVLKRKFGDSAKYPPEYDMVASWLAGNKSKGIICSGDCGRGKTLLCGFVIPVLLNHHYNLVVSCYHARDMATKLAEPPTICIFRA